MKCPCCSQEAGDGPFVFGNAISYRGKVVVLRLKSFRVAEALVKAMPGEVTRQQLFTALWGDRLPAYPVKTLHVHVHLLRGRLPEGLMIVSSREVGYSMRRTP